MDALDVYTKRNIYDYLARPEAKLIKKLPEGVELDDERIENLASVFPLQYLSMFEQMKKGN